MGSQWAVKQRRGGEGEMLEIYGTKMYNNSSTAELELELELTASVAVYIARGLLYLYNVRDDMMVRENNNGHTDHKQYWIILTLRTDCFVVTTDDKFVVFIATTDDFPGRRKCVAGGISSIG